MLLKNKKNINIQQLINKKFILKPYKIKSAKRLCNPSCNLTKKRKSKYIVKKQKKSQPVRRILKRKK